VLVSGNHVLNEKLGRRMGVTGVGGRGVVDTGEQEAKMRRWGVVISVFYFVVLFVLTCTGVLLAGSFQKNIGELPRGLEDIFAEPVYWVVVVALLAS
jgi:hypothetical protein